MVDTSKLKEGAQSITTETLEMESIPMDIRLPLFVVFAEFLGYVSPIISWAEQICLGKRIPPYQRKIVDIDALSIFNKMRDELKVEEIKHWWMEFYPLILAEYDEKLSQSEKDDLPF